MAVDGAITLNDGVKMRDIRMLSADDFQRNLGVISRCSIE
jgi:hypothetical protein